MSKVVLTLAAAVALALASASSASAHAKLVAAAPPANGVIAQSPTELDLTFSEAVNLAFTGVKIIGPDKAVIAIEAPALTDGDATFTAKVPATLAPGVYSVEWQALSTDGHKTHGTYTFTVKP
jgi:methionine-rich copper-binding protein CopC